MKFFENERKKNWVLQNVNRKKICEISGRIYFFRKSKTQKFRFQIMFIGSRMQNFRKVAQLDIP